MTNGVINIDEDNEDREWIRTQRKKQLPKDMTLDEAMTTLTQKPKPKLDEEKSKPK